MAEMRIVGFPSVDWPWLLRIELARDGDTERVSSGPGLGDFSGSIVDSRDIPGNLIFPLLDASKLASS
jgi:hypothetical protein